MNVMDELVDAFLSRDLEISYVFNCQTEEILFDVSQSVTGEPEIDWDDEEVVEFLVEIPQISSEQAHEVMVRFAKKQNNNLAYQLLAVLNGKKPFRTFKDKVSQLGIERQWYDFEYGFAKERMTEWLESLDESFI
ncbi:hypothetical protein PB01_19240 [Psychrobacillus glaciei]|uniref:Uncharacterized protein n=1 Tax=Psychrobacillus glaciei TaxID=2283160 RepID=A0A5J6ST73_9BACI|nr:UPF0158 family protein [Psychrobacillus glaciei]QFG00760.1 hypothetical protein PB01_19240 [Psychrobacillus glaciei]